MRIHIARKKDYKKSDSYSKKMGYSTTIFYASYDEYIRYKNIPFIKNNYVVWYKK
jgi:hypothetical protein